MASAEEHLQLARQAKNNYLAVSTSDYGNVPGMIEHASLTIEHLLKAMLATEKPDGVNTHRGHNLGALLQATTHDTSPFQNFVYDIDGLYTAARYDSGFSTSLMKEPEKTAKQLNDFINYTAKIVSQNRNR